MTAPLSFDFKDCDGTSGLEQGAAINAATFPNRNRHVPTSLVPAYGHLLVLNGVNVNQQVTDFGGVFLSARATLLVSPAPYGVLTPTLGGIGAGRIRGDGYKWIFRFKNSATGEVTGFSDLAVGSGISLGVALTGGGYAGQDAYFDFSAIDTRTNDPYMDTIQVFRNTTLEEKVFYLVKELFVTGGGGTALPFHDDNTDLDLLLSGAETADLLPNPSFSVGVLPPLAKAFLDADGAVELYGVVKMGSWSGGSAAVVNGSQIVTLAANQFPALERVQQRFVELGGLTNSKEYRVCDARMANTGAADPTLILAIYPAWQGATGSINFEIDDDRDPRFVYRSQPGLPSNFDVTKAFGVGSDVTDPLRHIFAFRGSKFAVTSGHIYVLSKTTVTIGGKDVEVQVAQTVADEGTCGLWSSALTPVGLVYVNSSRGVRIFSGGYKSLFGVEPPQPLGGSSPSANFGPLVQFQAIDPDYMDRTRVFYDGIQHRVYVSYCPLGGGGLGECLAYQYEDETAGTPAVWRGPWRVSMTALFTLKDDAGGDRVCFGDEFGNVLTGDDSPVDVLSTDVGQSVSGTIATVPHPAMFTASSGTFDPSSDRRVVGCPVVFTTAAGVVTVNRIVGFDGTRFQLLNTPAVALAVGTTFKIGAIRWKVKTAWLDGGEPILPKMLERVRMRLARAASGASTAELSAACDGGTTFQGEDGAAYTTIDPAPTIDGTVTPLVHADGRLHREADIGVMEGGRAQQVQIQGTSVDGHPRVDAAVADFEIHGGA